MTRMWRTTCTSTKGKCPFLYWEWPTKSNPHTGSNNDYENVTSILNWQRRRMKWNEIGRQLYITSFLAQKVEKVIQEKTVIQLLLKEYNLLRMLCWAAACCSCSCGQAAARSRAAPCLWSEQTRTQRDCDFPLLLLDTSSSSNCAAKAEAAGTAAVSLHQTLIHTIWITYKYKCMKCCRVHITAIIIEILQLFEVGGKNE